MTIDQAFLLSGSSILAGVINSVAGGGSFFTFPALIFAGVPSIAANATSTVAVWPGTVASIGAYREDILRERRLVPKMVAISLVGGLLGALILLRTPQATFDRILPWLLLVATAIFASGPAIARWLKRRGGSADAAARVGPMSLFIQLVISTYAGYFGGGAGLLMLAMLSLVGMTDIHAMNGVKTLLGATANLVAIVAFVSAGLIVWPQALLMMVGAAAGGYLGAHYARKTDPRIIRGTVIVVGIAMTIYFFLR